MSGIFGLINLNQAPIDRDSLLSMQNAMAYWGPDNKQFIADKNAGFGQLLLYNTPESLHESLPTKTDANQLFTAAARLDNRTTLCNQLDIPRSERAALPDSSLILGAYEKWGEDCPDHLLGDWAFAIWNPHEQRLFLARDHHGNTALYYYRNQNQFAFASTPKALLAIGALRRLNELYLAQVLISWPDYHGERTIDLDIYRLPPAHAMIVTPDKSHTWRYWRLEDTPQLHLPSFSDYVTGFLEIYTEAVHCRLRSYRPVGTTLSGGLDSSSLTALAARELQKQGKTLAAFTSVPLYDTTQTVQASRFGDETAFAQLTAIASSNINHHLISAAEVSPIAGLRQVLAIRNEPSHAGVNYFWIVALLKTAQMQGIGTLLTGQGGNATISWTGAPELGSLPKRMQHQGWKTGIKSILPAPLLRAIQLMRLHQISWQGTAINPAFANRLELAKQWIEVESNRHEVPYRWRTPIDKRMSIIKPGRSLACSLWDEMGAAFGLEVRDPTFDKRVMAYTLSIPDHHFVGQNGLDRRIIREAMAGVLPDGVRLNPMRGRQAADIGFRLRDSADEVAVVLKSLTNSQAADYLDLNKMQNTFTNVIHDINRKHTKFAGTVLMRGLEAGLFLENCAIVDHGSH